MVKSSSIHIHTEWNDAAPVTNLSGRSLKVGFGHVGVIVAVVLVAVVLSILSSLLLPLGGLVVWSVATGDELGDGLETGPC